MKPDSSSGEPRGEEFDPSLVDEAAKEPRPIRNGAAWFLVVILAIYCIYTLGAIVGERSRKPAAIPFASSTNAPPAPLRVHVAGKVKNPGVYTLPFNSRVEDAVKKAGGALPGADLGALNLAEWAQDGTKIDVPAKSAPLPTPTPTIIVREVPVPVPVPAPRAKASSTKPPVASMAELPRAVTESGDQSSNASPEWLKKNPLNLNTATLEQLQVLPGVGPKMAERIIAFRAENGAFKVVDDLDEVKGIGEKRMEDLRPLVRVR